MIFHLSAHQAYDHMIPGLTHRKWGEHIQRHNTWCDFSGPWIEYLSRSQYLLQQGAFVADVLYWFGEGAPLNVNDMQLEIPKGYDFDFCSSELVLQLRVENGRLVLPSGATYRYLLLRDSDRMTLPLARKVRALVEAGARVVGSKRPTGAPGLTNFPRSDREIEAISAAVWDTKRVRSGKTLAEVFAEDGLKPDFEGAGLKYIHRRAGETDIYFVSHQENGPADIACLFRVAGKIPELWDPETGAIRALPEYSEKEGRIAVPLHLEPMQSWFIVFREGPPARRTVAGWRNFATWTETGEVNGPWEVSFDAKWGGLRQPVVFPELADWSKHADPAIHYYSGTARYRATFDLPSSVSRQSPLLVDLGAVEVMAKVRVNGKDCGIAWKPPYRVDISRAVRPGKNELEVTVVNLWVNRMIGDEQLPLDGRWKDFETLLEWPDWFKNGTPRTSGRYTFTTARHYQKDSPLFPSGLLGPVTILVRKE